MKIAIDSGHGGQDPGAIGPAGTHEATLNDKIASLIAGGLNRLYNHSVRLVGVSDPDAVRQSNEWGADLYISVHCNAAENASASGIETFYHPTSVRGKALAELLLSKLALSFPDHKIRGAKPANFFVLRATKAVAALVECEFVSNAEEEQWLGLTETQWAIAETLADAIHRYTTGMRL